MDAVFIKPGIVGLLNLQDENAAFSFTVHFTQRFGETAFLY